MTTDQAPSPRPQARIWHRPYFWFLIALLVRLPAIWFHDFWHADGLAFLYLGSGFLHGHFVDLGEGLRVTLPGPTLSLGATGFLPSTWQSPAIFLLQSLLCAAWVFPLGALTRSRYGIAAAGWAMGLAALLHPLVVPAGMYQAEPFYLLTLLGALVALESERAGVRRWALLLWPLASLSRAEAPFVTLTALVVAASHYHRVKDPERRKSALLAVGLVLSVVIAYSIYFQRMTGSFLYGDYLKSALVPAMVKNAASSATGPAMGEMIRQGLPGFFSQAARRLPRLVAMDAFWWWLGALPAATFIFYPILLLGLWRRAGVLWAARSSLFTALNGLDALLLANLLVFHLVWRAHHHVPMVLLPMLPLFAAEIARFQQWRPRLPAIAAIFVLLWAGIHIYNNNAGKKPENFQPAYQLGQHLRAPAMSNDIVALDGAGRADWMGKAGLPFLIQDVTAQSWKEFARRFPQVRFAIHNPNIRNADRPPEDWSLIECLSGINEGEQPVCAYRVPDQ